MKLLSFGWCGCAAAAAVCLLAGCATHQVHVTVDGKPDGNGSRKHPYDLVSVFTKPGLVKAGDTVWIHGGTYQVGQIKQQRPGISGQPDKPIIYRAVPGERATVDGCLELASGYIWLWGLEITSPRDGINVRGGDGIKFINLAVHNTQLQGIGGWNKGNDHEFYGNLLYRNGRGKLDHGIYTQNDQTHATKIYLDNFIFENAGCGMHVYGERIQLANLYAEGNVCFSTGINLPHPADQPQMNMIFGGQQATSSVVVKDNCTYHPSANAKRGVDIGYQGKGNHDIVVEGNYFMCGANAMEAKGLGQNITVKNNTFWAPQGMVEATLAADAKKETILWDDNTYIANGHFDLAKWQDQTGFDKDSKLVQGKEGRPTGLHVVKRVNKYEPQRVHLVVYNWDHKDSVPIDVSDVCRKGSRYRIVNVVDYFGKPVAEGKVSGKTIDLPMTGHNYEPEFGAYILFRDVPK